MAAALYISLYLACEAFLSLAFWKTRNGFRNLFCTDSGAEQLAKLTYVNQ